MSTLVDKMYKLSVFSQSCHRTVHAKAMNIHEVAKEQEVKLQRKSMKPHPLLEPPMGIMASEGSV